MRLFIYILCLFLPYTVQGEEEPKLLSKTDLMTIREEAEQGSPHCQLILGILKDLASESYQDLIEAAEWYWLSAEQGNACAEKRLEQLLIEFDQHVQSKQQRKYGCNHSRPEYNTRMSRELREESIQFTSDRPDPADANERVYGPGTGDWNQGILKSDYEKIERARDELLAKMNEFHIQAESMKIDSLKKEIEKLDQKSKELCEKAFFDLICAISQQFPLALRAAEC